MAKARFEQKEYYLGVEVTTQENRNERWRLFLPNLWQARYNGAKTLPTMTDEHIFAVARPESLEYAVGIGGGK